MILCRISTLSYLIHSPRGLRAAFKDPAHLKPRNRATIIIHMAIYAQDCIWGLYRVCAVRNS